MTAELAPGFYGKMPSHGDFVSRRLARAFIDPWDDWLQRAMATSRQALGARWLELYLVSPIWRFVLSPSLCGAEAACGLVMPSVDRVGRHFPLTLSMSLAPGRDPFTVASLWSSWFARAEEAMLSCLDDGSALEPFDERLQALGLPIDDEGRDGPAPGEPRIPGAAIAWPLPGALGATDPLWRYAGLVGRLAQRTFGPYSLWWTAGSERVSAGLMIFAGLPPSEAFAGFLDDLAVERQAVKGSPLGEIAGALGEVKA